MNTTWHNHFRQRMTDFSSEESHQNSIPISIKIRVTGGCFHRSCSPSAYEEIDRCLAKIRLQGQFRFEEHESGPELLVYAALTTAGITLTTGIINLVTAIINARAKGIKKGDRPREPLELIIRGHWRDGEYIEEKILKFPSECPPRPEEIESLLNSALAKQTPFLKTDRVDDENKDAAT